MQNSITIRDATPGDVAAIFNLLSQLGWSSYVRKRVSKDYILSYLEFSHNNILLVEIPSSDAVIPRAEICGLLAYSIRPDLYHGGDACLVENFVIDKERRGQGIGSALFTHLLSRLYEIECTTIFVDVEPNNHRAIHFYRQHGLNHQVILLERHL